MERKTNREMAAIDQGFKETCQMAGVFPSRRRYAQYKHIGREKFLKRRNGGLTNPQAIK